MRQRSMQQNRWRQKKRQRKKMRQTKIEHERGSNNDNT